MLRAPPEEVDASDSTAVGGGGTKPSGGFATVALAVAAASLSVLSTLAILDTSMSWIAHKMSSLDAYWKSASGTPNSERNCWG